MKTMQQVELARVRKSLIDANRTLSQSPDCVEKALFQLEQILELAGPYSKSRKMLLRLGKILLAVSEPAIIVPACPDYSHENGKYTFRSLRGGVSLLSEKHIDFLKQINAILPEAKVLFLLADHEADDPELCRVVGKTREEFANLVIESVRATRKRTEEFGWKVELMTVVIPNLIAEEARISEWIANNPEFTRRIVSETISRGEMYCKISRSFTQKEKELRTIRTAAQYLALGQFVARSSHLVCNHTTTNLSWYLRTEAALIHNPVSVY